MDGSLTYLCSSVCPAEARQQCQAYRGRLSELEQQLQRREFERAQWEWRAQDAESKAAAAEERAQAGSEAADAGHAAALRLAEQRAGQAEARAAEKEAQAKAASLQVLVGQGWDSSPCQVSAICACTARCVGHGMVCGCGQ